MSLYKVYVYVIRNRNVHVFLLTLNKSLSPFLFLFPPLPVMLPTRVGENFKFINQIIELVVCCFSSKI
jgi:hypothetical protein